ncbi:ferredoxin reductase family protein [Roseovarius albus]|nr:ferric reductase-like transmembrane domain-containing protein [Roseovarius albus]
MLPNVSDQIALFSQCLGLAALVLMAWGQILATRLPGIEFMFGGLDRVYILHKWAGIAAMVAILLHDTIDAEMRDLGRETVLTEIAETLGEISLYGLLVLVVISVATFIPYHLWKWSHKAMGALFAAASFHFFFIMKPFATSDPAGLYTGAFCLAGFLAYVWTLLPEEVRPSRAYRISNLEQTGGATAITMVPDAAGLRPAPGQFGIFSFVGSGHGEPHPYSFSKTSSDGTLRVTVKPLGDFTTRLGHILETGQVVRVQGPFGRFRLSGKSPEVWIAGGIGITPFLTWATSLKADADPVHLFYCVRTRNDAVHLSEIEEIAKSKPNLSLHVIVSAEGNRLTADGIAKVVGADLSGVKASFCGPVSLRRVLQKDLLRYGVTPRRFHYEEFEFRTGIGLKRLAQWLVGKSWGAAPHIVNIKSE